MTSVPRYLAGPGCAGTVLRVLQRAGWDIAQADGITGAVSPDRRVTIGLVPDDGGLSGGTGPCWSVRVVTHADLPAAEWYAFFTENTPAELVAAFLADLTSGEPLELSRCD